MFISAGCARLDLSDWAARGDVRDTDARERGVSSVLTREYCNSWTLRSWEQRVRALWHERNFNQQQHTVLPTTVPRADARGLASVVTLSASR